MTEYPHTALWVVGEPGVGKTTFCRKLFATYGPLCVHVPKPKWTTFGPERALRRMEIGPQHMCAAVGSWKGDTFDGGDSVPPSDIKPALAVYAEYFTGYKLVVFDGDKFANANATEFVRNALEEKTSKALALAGLQYRLVCLYFVGEGAASDGRAARGSKQNASWIKGRRTKSARFAEAFKQFGEVITIDRDAQTTKTGDSRHAT